MRLDNFLTKALSISRSEAVKIIESADEKLEEIMTDRMEFIESLDMI